MSDIIVMTKCDSYLVEDGLSPLGERGVTAYGEPYAVDNVSGQDRSVRTPQRR
jgi:hypothetical protein